MSECNSRHTPTDKTPLEKRERKPHRSGQEYEYGEVPQTGLGGSGSGADPNAQCAREGDGGERAAGARTDADSEGVDDIDREIEEEIAADVDEHPTRQSGSDRGVQGFGRSGKGDHSGSDVESFIGNRPSNDAR